MRGETVTVRGQVQGVGFRPTVWRIARDLGLAGDVRNTGAGVEIRLWGSEDSLDGFASRLSSELPPLARVDEISRTPHSENDDGEVSDVFVSDGFEIVGSSDGEMNTSITPDAAVCDACLEEMRDPFADRYRYPFINCTQCGPRFSIVQSAPYDRKHTTMRDFELCSTCTDQYEDPTDRRFHAQPIACHSCGPKAWVERLGGGAVHHEAFSMMDDVDAAGGMLIMGHIVAIKGIGGFHLACDATKAEVVEELRRLKGRRGKAFALMARDLDIIREYAVVSAEEQELLKSAQAPIVLLKRAGAALPDSVAPGLDRIGFMLPYTPMHHLMLRRMKRPVVMTSGNPSGQPQCIDNDDARERLAGIAGFALMHNRDIANRIDDSVVRVDLGRTRIIRRGRGYAPASLKLPQGFEVGPQILALGSELKNTFCLVRRGEAILSQHMGDLEDVATSVDVEKNLALYQDLYQHAPDVIAV
ncbi:MAG: carbamoyltransferase HypF, partial [Pseudomonadota bacterium]